MPLSLISPVSVLVQSSSLVSYPSESQLYKFVQYKEHWAAGSFYSAVKCTTNHHGQHGGMDSDDESIPDAGKVYG